MASSNNVLRVYYVRISSMPRTRATKISGTPLPILPEYYPSGIRRHTILPIRNQEPPRYLPNQERAGAIKKIQKTRGVLKKTPQKTNNT